MSAPRHMAIALGLAIAAALGGCSTNTKGAWACPADRGVTCQSIAVLDQGRERSRQAKTDRNPAGTGPVRWWDAAETLTGNFDLGPRREPDQFVKVLIAGWTDPGGDYHAPSEVYAVVRHGGWWAPPPATPLTTPRVDAKVEKPGPRAAKAGTAADAPPPPPKGATPAQPASDR